MKESIANAFNEQIAHELRNVLIYKEIQTYFDKIQLTNLSRYFMKQSNHEFEHANILIKYLNNRIGGEYKTQEIDYSIKFENIEEVAQAYLRTEMETTESIESLYGLILDERSFIDINFMAHFLEEQIEEENQAEKFVMISKNTNDLVVLDLYYSEEGED